MSKIRGFDFMLFVGTGATKTVFAGSRTVKFDDKSEKIDTTTRDGQSYVLGFPEYSLDVDGLVDFESTGGTNTHTVMDIYKSQAIINWQFGLSTNSTYPQTLKTASKYLSGAGRILNVSISSAYNGAVEYSVNIGGIGDWALNP